MTELREILERTISANPSDQQIALDYLRQAKDNNFTEFLKQLATILKSTSEKPTVRQAAGLQLKNVLVTKEEKLREQLVQRWVGLPAPSREEIKNTVLTTLGTETTRPSIAAQCVASIACAELPLNLWLEVITRLMNNVIDPSATEMLKESSLEALGYICQDLESDVLSSRSKEILTAIVHGMKQEEQSNNVRLAATQALLNSLEFTKCSFEKDDERNTLMQVICEATQMKSDKRVCVAALQCLVNIMSLYYRFMEPYMTKALFPITFDAMQSQEDEICLQGIEFWSNVCDEEIELSVEAEEAADQGRPPENVSKFYAKGALQFISPVLLKCLTRQDDCDDEDEWTPAKAAGVCLMLMSQCVGEDVLAQSLTFITTNIVNPDWHFRDAAVMAFGSVLDGIESTKLKPLVQEALPTMIGLLKDPHITVRDSAAWCLGRLCEVCPDVVLVPHILQILLPALSEGLHQEPRVATNICWAVSGLAQAAYEQAAENVTNETGQPETYILSTCFEAMIRELVKTTDRADANASNLRNAAYEAVMELIKNSPMDCYPIVHSTLLIVLKKLQILQQMESSLGSASTSDASQLHDLQSLLCATLQSVLSKMQKDDALKVSDEVMIALLQILSHAASKPGGTVMEDALMATSALVTVLGPDFAKYMEHLKLFIVASLRNHAEHQVCQAAVGLVADICRCLEKSILPYVEEFMVLLLEILTDMNMDKSVKPQVVAVFGDLALAIGPHFFKFLDTVLTTLQQASTAVVDPSDFDAVDYLNQLRESCLEAYTGILQGFRGDASGTINPELQRIQPYMPQILGFLDRIALDRNQPDSVLAAAVGLIGDLLSVYGHAILKAIDRDPINDLLLKARRAKSSKTKSLATWASKELKKLKVSAA